MVPATNLLTVRTKTGQILVLEERIGRGGEVLLPGAERAVDDGIWVHVQVKDRDGWVRVDLLEGMP